MRAATLRYARRCTRYGERDDEAVKAELRGAIRSAPCNPGGNVEAPYCQDHYLDRMIAGAFALLAGDAEIQTMRPHHAAPAHTVDQARQTIAEHVGGFIRRALDWHGLEAAEQVEQPPEHAALVVGVGVGKSRAVREAIPAYIEAARAKETIRHRILWLVPTHKLGNETLALMEGLGLSVAVMRGRDAEEPGTADPEDEIPAGKMCLNLPAVEDALKLGYDVERHACGTGKPGEPACPYRKQCAYQKQKPIVAQADVVIAAHQSLFHRLPNKVSSNLGLVIADESWWQAGLHPNAAVRLASFAEEPLTFPVQQKVKIGAKSYRYRPSEMDTNDLHALSAKAQEAFTATADGDLVSRESVVAAGLTAEQCAAARKLEWERKIEGAVYPGMPLDERKTGVERAAGNAGIPRRAGIWKALEALLAGDDTHTGRLQLGTRSDTEGSARVILLHSRSEVREDIAALPMLCMDATMPVAIVRHFMPRLSVLADVQAAAPHMEIRQITGGWGKTSLVTSKRQDDSENRRRVGLVGEVVDFVRINSGDNALVVTYEAIEERFAGPGIRTGHFNAISGLDTFGDVRSLFVIGRPLVVRI